MKIIDINCDLGEGIADEALLMTYISSCNIACGGHFGDENSIDKTIELALKNGIGIGAHPSFPDQINFGRKILNISEDALRKSIASQLNLFSERLALQHAKMNHIKAHGALYALIANDSKVAAIYLDAIATYVENVFLYVPYNSVIEKLAKERNIKIKYEAFIDRNYNDDLSLVARSNENAIINNATAAFDHLLNILKIGKVKTINKSLKTIKADTFCIHGDTKNALIILKELTLLLKEQNITIA
jgi:UPF0271 protein